ncbi:MAG: hypothetical protein AAF449_05880 [Myxococcota bacterium]
MSDEPDGSDERVDHRFVRTLQMRVRAKNPKIERDDDRPSPSSNAPEDTMPAVSLYERLEQTDEPELIDEARAELEAVLWTDIPPEPVSKKARKALPREQPTVRVPPPTAPEEPVQKTLPREIPRLIRPARVEDPVPPERVQTQPQAHTPVPLSPFDDDETIVATPRPALMPTPVIPQVVPRARIMAGGTKAAAVEVRRQKIIRETIPDIRSRLLKLYGGIVDEPRLKRLDALLLGEYDDHQASSTASSKRALEELLHDRAFTPLSLDIRAELLKTIADAEEAPTTIKSLAAIAKTKVLTRLSTSAQNDLHSLFRRLDMDGRAKFARWAARGLQNGRSAVEDIDGDGQTVLTHLRAIAASEDIHDFWRIQGLNIEAVTHLIISTMALPARISCDGSVASVGALLEFALADIAPATLAALWRALLGRSEKIQFRGHRAVPMEPLRESTRRPTPIRGLLNQLPDFLGQPQDLGYGTPSGSQIRGETLAMVAEQLFGSRYSVVAGAPAIGRHLKRLGPDARRVPPAFVSLLHDHGERLFVFDRFETDALFIRSPHGRSTKRSGDVRELPLRTAVAPERGLDRVSMEAFQDIAGIAVFPSP